MPQKKRSTTLQTLRQRTTLRRPTPGVSVPASRKKTNSEAPRAKPGGPSGEAGERGAGSGAALPAPPVPDATKVTSGQACEGCSDPRRSPPLTRPSPDPATKIPATKAPPRRYRPRRALAGRRRWPRPRRGQRPLLRRRPRPQGCRFSRHSRGTPVCEDRRTGRSGRRAARCARKAGHTVTLVLPRYRGIDGAGPTATDLTSVRGCTTSGHAAREDAA